MNEKISRIKEFFGIKESTVESSSDKLPSVKAKEASEQKAERREKQFDFEVAVAAKEKSPGKGEDRTIVYNDNEKSLFAVLDGLGGDKEENNGGDVAAQIVAESFKEALTKETNLPKDSKAVEQLMKEAVVSAQKELEQSPEAKIYGNMGTTLSAMLSYNNKATIISVGDSRVYRRRNGKLEQLSYEDSVTHIIRANRLDINTSILSNHLPDESSHDVILNEVLGSAKKMSGFSEYNQKIIDKLINSEFTRDDGTTLKIREASLKELRNKNLQSITAKKGNVVFPHVLTVDIEDGDEFLITSDGLTDNCQDRNIEQGLNKLEGKSSQEKAVNLRAYAEKMQDKTHYRDANKPDDISIIYIEAKSKKGAREEEFEEISMDDLVEEAIG